MRKVFAATFAISLVLALATGSLWAAPHKFKLHRGATLNGTELQAGSYELELNGEGEALIYRNGKMVTKARVTTKPLSNGDAPSSVLQAADGSLREIRLKEQVVVFVR